MKILLLLPLLGVALAYTDVNDNIVSGTLLQDPAKARKETQELTACLLDEGPCDGFNAVAKTHVVQSLADGCAECDIVQKRGAVKFLKSLKNDYPDLWAKFEKRYDPDRTKYDNMLKVLSGFN
ncbi:allergen Tha p 1-like isoform X2 [Aricia agestis]|nr:allergen Tha p 1-like isoform X2 [Aricia agestis]